MEDLQTRVKRGTTTDDSIRPAFKNADEFTWPFQEIATEFAWGSVWNRKGQSLRDRSLVILAQCIALNRPNEIRIQPRRHLMP